MNVVESLDHDQVTSSNMENRIPSSSSSTSTDPPASTTTSPCPEGFINNDSASTIIPESSEAQFDKSKPSPSSLDPKQHSFPRTGSSKLKRANSSSSTFEDREKVRSRLLNFGNFFNKDSNNNNTTTNIDGQLRISRKNSTSNKVSMTSSSGLYRHSNEVVSPFDPTSSYFRSHKSLSVSNSLDCRLVTTEEACHFLISHYTTELPEVETMFPWLHGVHKNNLAQIRFLSNLTYGTSGLNVGQDSDDESLMTIQTPSNVRNLMIVRSSNTNGEVSSAYESIITETVGLVKGTVSSDDILVSVNGIRNLSLYLSNTLDASILEKFSLESVLRDCYIAKVLPVFKDMDPQFGVSLRNFHIQVSKVSNISDILVYCFNNDHRGCMKIENDSDLLGKSCKCVSLARLIHIAQLQYIIEHPEVSPQNNNLSLQFSRNEKLYNTFVVEDPSIELFSKFNLLAIPILSPDSSIKLPGSLCSEYDLNVFNNWDCNYLYREKLEISKMSSATPVTSNVWFGNTTDFECLQIQLNENNNEYIPSPELTCPVSFSPPLHCDPNNSVVTLTKEDFANKQPKDMDSRLITFPKSNWKIFIHCVEGVRFPTLAELASLFDNSDELGQIYLEIPPSGSVCISDLSEEDILSIVNVCKLCFYKCNEERTGLFYCSDGYTETALLGLCFIMYAEKLKLDEAIIKLHVTYGRPFFIFKSDYALLQQLEPIMNHYSPLNLGIRDKFELETDSFYVKTVLLTPKSAGSPAFPKSFQMTTKNSTSNADGSESFVTPTGHHIVQLREGATHAAEEVIPDIVSPDPTHHSAADCCKEVQGSLPSRILPHLYLGSLSHANSLPLMKAIGINYIVSVGERIPWVDEIACDLSTTQSGCEILSIEPGQCTSTGDKCGITEVMRISNINDDGVGTLTTTINDALQFIERCYENGGKVLVHCQVGVSRSATVCIAEVMKRLNITLPRAYLFVRVRRLNVIIQPNLKLMYELFKWEESFVKTKIQESRAQQHITTGRLSLAPTTNRTNSLSSAQSTGGSSLFSLTTSQRSSISTTFGSSSSFRDSRNSFNSKTRNYTYNRQGTIDAGSVVEEEDDEEQDPEAIDDVFINSDSSDSESTPSALLSSSEPNSGSISTTIPTTKFKNISFASPTSATSSTNNTSIATQIMMNNQSYSSGNTEDSTISPKSSIDLSLPGGIIKSNAQGFLREVDWSILCREIFSLNRAYIKPAS